MKYLLPVVIVFLLFSFASSVFSQSASPSQFNFDQAYRDYLYNSDQYRKANLDYELYRSQYLKFKTLKSQENAYSATLSLLKTRDETIKTYMTALRLKLSETPGADGAKKAVIFTKIDQEVAWHTAHHNSLPSAGSLEDLVSDSDEAKARFNADRPLFYDSLIAISGGKVAYVRGKEEEILAALKEKTAEIRANGDKNTQILERWELDTEEKITRCKEKEAEAYAAIAKAGASGNEAATSYNQALFRLKEAFQYLKEANSYLKEIVNEIKYQD